MSETIADLVRSDREILSFFADASFVTNPAVVTASVNSNPEIVKERIRRLCEQGYLETHGYFDDIYKITDEGERALTNTTNRASSERVIETKQ
ncbi:hypothetical protein [Halorussus ruber]|uniref:hypothetical protein n=1 Tax=Halorussus ruber TaxID=1126238 RepID=UPI00109316F0|nr:hypothetical protein [Halorussus ruber]